MSLENVINGDVPHHQQRDITRLCIKCALLLLQHGAESMLVEQLSARLGMALGMDSVESSISANAVVLTTISQGNCLTSTRKNTDRGINMQVVTEVQHIVILAEHRLLDAKDVEKRFENIKPLRYPRWLVVIMVALSCGCFSKLNGGGWDAFSISFVASGLAMFVRQSLTARHMNPLINFCITAFVATSASGLLMRLPFFEQASSVAMAASVLLLVPGFPLINAVADMFKGHVNTGVGALGDGQLADLIHLYWGGIRDGTLGFAGVGVSLLWALLQDMVLAAIPALGFAMVFNVPVRALRYCALLGAIGHGSRMLMIHFGMNIELASLVASIMIGINWSRWLLAHPKVFTVAAVIPMFPGISAYTAMISVVEISHLGYSEALMSTMVTNFLKASFIVGALSIGLSLPGLWLYRKRPGV